MLRRFAYLLSFFGLTWVYFLLQKTVFMLCNAVKDYSFTDYLQVMWHGARLDATVAAWLTVLPLVFVFASIWYRHFPARKILTFYYIIAALATAFMFMGDLSVFSLTGNKWNASVSIPQNLANMSGGYVAGKAGWSLLIAILLCIAYRGLTPRHFPKINMIGQQLLNTLWIIPLGGLLCVGMRGGIQPVHASDATFSKDSFLNMAAVNPCFSVFPSLQWHSTAEESTVDNEVPAQTNIPKGLYPKSNADTKYVLTTNKPNVLVVLLNGFSSSYLQKTKGKAAMAPNVYKLTQKGVYFSRCFASSFSPDLGMASTLNGYPVPPSASMGDMPKKSNLASALASVGYVTQFVQGSDPGALTDYLQDGGFQQILSVENLSPKAGKDNNGDVLNYLLQNIKQRSIDKPWFTTVRLLSDKKSNTIAYTDQCIGQFVNAFSRLPQWKSTLIVFLSDCGTAYTANDKTFSPKFFRIPMLWTGGAMRYSFEYKKMMNQTDLVSTLLAQLGVSSKAFPYSRNVLSSSYTHPFAYYTFSQGFGFVDNTGASAYDMKAGKVCYEVYPHKERVNNGKAIFQTLQNEWGK